jgi:hypothetical protein
MRNSAHLARAGAASEGQERAARGCGDGYVTARHGRGTPAAPSGTAARAIAVTP